MFYRLALVGIIFFMGVFIDVNAQWSAMDDLPRPSSTWENDYQTRLGYLFDPYLPYSDRSCSGEDAGKNTWHPLLANMKTYPENIETYITGKADEYINSTYCGTFYKAFTCPGLSYYYFYYKDSIAKYQPDQLSKIEDNVYSSWRYMFSQDHLFDRCCGYNDEGGKEFNSENFHWMYRSSGYLFAHEFHDPGVSGRDNHDLSVYIYDYDENRSPSYYGSTIDNVDAIRYFDGFVDNLTRALYSAGRVEWNSNNYWGHTFTPLLTMYEGADRCNDPDGVENKKKAKAMLDWMTIESAVHYLDGFNIAPDSRAKGNVHLPFSGSMAAFNYAYFADSENHPSYPASIWEDENPGLSESGIMLHSSFRPSELVIDIAQKNFPLPVEIQSAKPFYHIDFGNYFDHGEYPYHDWRGDTERSRRFEFETTYLGDNFILSSAAVGRPDGNIGTFSEQAMWMLGVRGTDSGAIKITGNAGNRYGVAGRFAYEQIGQFRNCMMRLVQHSNSSYNNIWVLVPDTGFDINSQSATGEWFEWVGNDLLVNLGNGVYAAWISSASTSIDFQEDGDYSKIKWNYAADELGGLVLEVGTQNEFGSFDHFKSSISGATLSKLNDSTYEYQSAGSHVLKMTHTGTRPYEMTPNTYDDQSVPNGGWYPKVWGDGEYIDFFSWDSYKTVHGHPVIYQPWGASEMYLQPGDTAYLIDVNENTAEVSYYKGGTVPVNMPEAEGGNAAKSCQVYPNPSNGKFFIDAPEIDQKAVLNIYDLTGRMVYSIKINDDRDKQPFEADISAHINKGLYLYSVYTVNRQISSGKLLIQ